MNLKYQEILGFVQKASLLNPSSLGLAPYAQTADILPSSAGGVKNQIEIFQSGIIDKTVMNEVAGLA